MDTRSRVLVIIPSYNEAASIAQVIDELRQDFAEADLLVVDDGSRDETASIARGLNVTCISQPFNMGYASALQTGFKYAARHGYDYVVQFDGDGQHIAAEARKLYEHVRTTQADLGLGSRFLGDTGYHNSAMRSLGTAFFRKLVAWFGGQPIQDPTTGLQCLSRKYFVIFSGMQGFADYPDANLLIELLKSGAKVEEIPARMRLRTTGASMHSGILKPLRYMILMMYSILIVLLRRKNRFLAARPPAPRAE